MRFEIWRVCIKDFHDVFTFKIIVKNEENWKIKKEILNQLT